jgi:hypothetical protein
MTRNVTMAVIAKSPEPTRVKTRLCPPCTPVEAAALARAALADTLDAVLHTPARRHVLVLDGRCGSWLPNGIEVIFQRGTGLADRLAAAFGDIGGPALLIGMDTPQVTPELLGWCADRLLEDDTDAALGRAIDGGWWCIGLRRADPAVFLDVPMSTPTTCDAQRRRLQALALRVVDLPVLADFDDIDAACDVAAAIPTSRFARSLAQLPVMARR